MLELTFTPLIPSPQAAPFYCNFYNQYSLIQINDTLLSQVTEILPVEKREALIAALENFDSDQDQAAIWRLGAGIMDPAQMRRRKEKRGLSLEVVNILREEGVDPLIWYMQVNEFLLMYAVCEQAIKEYLVSQSPDYTDKDLSEANLLKTLFKSMEVNSRAREKEFLRELSEATNEVLNEKNRILALWDYYTMLRHAFAHAGGQVTDKLKGKVKPTMKRWHGKFTQITSSMFIELACFEDELVDGNLFTDPFSGRVVKISILQLNFFRNLIVRLVESLERTLHPSDYDLPDFNPCHL